MIQTLLLRPCLLGKDKSLSNIWPFFQMFWGEWLSRPVLARSGDMPGETSGCCKYAVILYTTLTFYICGFWINWAFKQNKLVLNQTLKFIVENFIYKWLNYLFKAISSLNVINVRKSMIEPPRSSRRLTLSYDEKNTITRRCTNYRSCNECARGRKKFCHMCFQQQNCRMKESYVNDHMEQRVIIEKEEFLQISPLAHPFG